MILALSAGRDSPAELRARLALDPDRQRALLEAVPPGIGEMAVLSTCHRTEIYATADGPVSEALHSIAALLPGLLPTDHHDLNLMEGPEAVEHLFRVACGLDSLVIGEPQVLGQVRRAYVAAKEAGAAGPGLSRVFDRAIRLGRRVRAETPLGRIGHSVGSIAAEYLIKRFSSVEDRAGAIVGAGEAAGDAARWLRRAGARLAVVGRTPASAERLAGAVEATSHPLDDLPKVLEWSEFAVVAVTGGLLIHPSQVPRRSTAEPFVLLDLSVPPAVEVDGRGDVEVRTLEELPGPRGPEVTAAVLDAEAMVHEEVANLEKWAGSPASGASIRELRSRAEHLVREEIARTVAGMDLDPDEEERVAGMGMRIAKKLLHGPTTAMREADEETRALIRRLFGLES